MLGCASQSGARMTLILSNDDVEKLLTMPECIDVMEEAYIELAEGRGDLTHPLRLLRADDTS